MGADSPAASFDARSLDRAYSFLDACPVGFLHDLVALPVGALSDRVHGLRTWRDALIAGREPPVGPWPPPEIAAPARQALQDLGLVRFLRDQPQLVDDLLHDILTSFAEQHTTFESAVTERLRELEELERIQLAEQDPPIDAAPLDGERLRRQAEEEVAIRGAAPDAGLLEAWGERARCWASIADVFGDLGQLMGRGWDLSLGVLRHSGWKDLVRLRALVEKLPQIQEIIRSLGRLQQSNQDDESVAETLFEPVRRLEEELQEVRTPHVPGETRGIVRSGEIARMLPVEAINFGHPKLRMLWHARRAERALITYRVEGVEFERVQVEREAQVAVEGRRPRPERGPILAVVDTSGSMHGTPELVAKAMVLEASRVAHSEKRACYAYMYSGPGQIVEHELSVTGEGIGKLLAFLGTSFGGGTDVAVLERVVARLREEAWRKADVVFATDGEWRADARLIRAVHEARDQGTRFHGVQIGNRGRTGLHDVCDPVHVFQDWAAMGGWQS